MGAAMKLASSTPTMNALAAEVSIKMEELRCEVLLGGHVPGTLNFVADALSRLASDKELPKSLHDCNRRKVPSRGQAFYRAWSLSQKES